MSIAFLLTTLIVVATPGTGALYTVATGIAHGAKASVVAAVGCTLGIVPHMLAAVTGLAAILHSSAVAFQTLKYVGVAYLLYLAWLTWRDKSDLVPEAGPVQAPSALRVVGMAVAVNVLNPKLTLFFFAFLPQFVASAAPDAVLQMLWLSGVFMAATLVVFAGYGVFAAGVRTHVIGRPRVVTGMRRTFAASYVALAARMAVTAR
ncbi:MAG TPA: LysE family translocator [Mycobacterium sp.]|jgi:threonine/homoserine/homoserine lactone efflux protein|nr:LysE family translocator [Mycobacterium sp.]